VRLPRYLEVILCGRTLTVVGGTFRNSLRMEDPANSATPANDAGSCVEALLGLRGSPPATRLPGVTALDNVSMAAVEGSSAHLPAPTAPPKRARSEISFIPPSPGLVDDRGVIQDQHSDELQSSQARYLPTHGHHAQSVPPPAYSGSTSFANISEWTPPPRPALPSLQTLTSGVYEARQSLPEASSWAMAPGYALAQPPHQLYHPLAPRSMPFTHQHASLRSQHTEIYSHGSAGVPQMQTALTTSHLRPPSIPFYYASPAAPMVPVLEQHITSVSSHPAYELDHRHALSEYGVDPLDPLPRAQSSLLGSFGRDSTSHGRTTAFPSVLHRPQSPRAVPRPEYVTERDTPGSLSSAPSNTRGQSGVSAHHHAESSEHEDIEVSDEDYQGYGHETEQSLRGGPAVEPRVPRGPTYVTNAQSGLSAVAIVAASAAPLSPLVSRCDGDASLSESDAAVSAPLAALAEVALYASPARASEWAPGARSVPRETENTAAYMPPRLSPKRAGRSAGGSSSEQYAQGGEVTRCPCGSVRNSAFMIACDGCNTWQHGRCMGIRKKGETPDVYFCHICRPDDLRPNCIAHPRFRERTGRDRDKGKLSDPTLSSVKPVELRRLFSEDLKAREQSDKAFDKEELFNRYAGLYRHQFGKDRQSIVEGLAVVAQMERIEVQQRLEEALKRLRGSAANHTDCERGEHGISGDRFVESAGRCYPQNLTESPEMAPAEIGECAVYGMEVRRDSRRQTNCDQEGSRFRKKGTNDTGRDSDLRKRVHSESAVESFIGREDAADQKNSSGRGGGKRSRRPTANPTDLGGDLGMFGSDPEAVSDVPTGGRQLSREERKLSQIMKMFKKMEEKEERGRRKPRAGATDSPKSAQAEESCSRANGHRSDRQHSRDREAICAVDMQPSGTTAHASARERSSQAKKKIKGDTDFYDGGSTQENEGRVGAAVESSGILGADSASATVDRIREPASIAAAQPHHGHTENGGLGSTHKNMLQNDRVVVQGTEPIKDSACGKEKGQKPVSLLREATSDCREGHVYEEAKTWSPILTEVGRGDANRCRCAVAAKACDSVGTARPHEVDSHLRKGEGNELSLLKEVGLVRVALRSTHDVKQGRTEECSKLCHEGAGPKMCILSDAGSERTNQPKEDVYVDRHRVSNSGGENNTAPCRKPVEPVDGKCEFSQRSLGHVADTTVSIEHQLIANVGDLGEVELSPKPEHTLVLPNVGLSADAISTLVNGSVCTNERKQEKVAEYNSGGRVHISPDGAEDNNASFATDLLQSGVDRSVDGTGGEREKHEGSGVHEVESRRKHRDTGRGRKRKRKRDLVRGLGHFNETDPVGTSGLQDQLGPKHQSVFEPPDGNVSDMEYALVPDITDVAPDEKVKVGYGPLLKPRVDMSSAKEEIFGEIRPSLVTKVSTAEADMVDRAMIDLGVERRGYASVPESDSGGLSRSMHRNGKGLKSGDASNREEESVYEAETPCMLRESVESQDVSKKGRSSTSICERDFSETRMNGSNGGAGARLHSGIVDTCGSPGAKGNVSWDAGVKCRYHRVCDVDRALSVRDERPDRDSRCGASIVISGRSLADRGSDDTASARVLYAVQSGFYADDDTEMTIPGHDGYERTGRKPLKKKVDEPLGTMETNNNASGITQTLCKSRAVLPKREGTESDHERVGGIGARGVAKNLDRKVQLLDVALPSSSTLSPLSVAVDSRLSGVAPSSESLDGDEVRSWRERCVAVAPSVVRRASDRQAADTAEIEVPIFVPGPSVLGSNLVPLSQRSSMDVTYLIEKEAMENKLELPSKKLWLLTRSEELQEKSASEASQLHFPAKRVWLKRAEEMEALASEIEERRSLHSSELDPNYDEEQVMMKAGPPRERVSVSMVVVSQRSTLPDHGRQLESSILLNTSAMRRGEGVWFQESGASEHADEDSGRDAEFCEDVRRVVIYSREGARADCLKKRPKLLLPESSLVTLACTDEASQPITSESPRAIFSPGYKAPVAHPRLIIASSVPSPGGTGFAATMTTTQRTSPRAAEELVAPILSDSSGMHNDAVLSGRSPSSRSASPLLKKRCVNKDDEFSRKMAPNVPSPVAVSPSTPRLLNVPTTQNSGMRDTGINRSSTSPMECPSTSPAPLSATRSAEGRIPRRPGFVEALLSFADGGGQELLQPQGGRHHRSEERTSLEGGTPQTNSSTSLSVQTRTQGRRDTDISHVDAEFALKTDGRAMPRGGVTSAHDADRAILRPIAASEIVSSPVGISSVLKESGDTTARIPNVGSGQYSVRPGIAASTRWRAAMRYGNTVPGLGDGSPRMPGSVASEMRDERSAGRVHMRWNDPPSQGGGPPSRRSFPPPSSHSSNGEFGFRNKESSVTGGECEFQNVVEHPKADSKGEYPTFVQSIPARTARGDYGAQSASAAWSNYRQRNGWHRGSHSDPEMKRGGYRRGGFSDQEY
jgi:hypothetical protein